MKSWALAVFPEPVIPLCWRKVRDDIGSEKREDVPEDDRLRLIAPSHEKVDSRSEVVKMWG